MAFLSDGVMPDIETIQAENERLIALSHKNESHIENIQATRNELQAAIQKMPVQIGVGAAVLFGAVYWFLIRRP